MSGMNGVRLVLLSLLLAVNWNKQHGVVAKVYTAGSTTVDVYIEYLDNYGSNTKCAKYTSGAPDKYDTICFRSTITDQGVFKGCEVKLDDEYCNSCGVCEDSDENVGFSIDCFNIEPAETTKECVLWTDMSVQEVLVDDIFESQPFDFGDNATRETSEDNGAKPATSSFGFRASTKYSLFFIAVVTLFSFHPTRW